MFAWGDPRTRFATVVADPRSSPEVLNFFPNHIGYLALCWRDENRTRLILNVDVINQHARYRVCLAKFLPRSPREVQVVDHEVRALALKTPHFVSEYEVAELIKWHRVRPIDVNATLTGYECLREFEQVGPTQRVVFDARLLRGEVVFFWFSFTTCHDSVFLARSDE